MALVLLLVFGSGFTAALTTKARSGPGGGEQSPWRWRDLPAQLMTEWRLEPVGLELPPCPASLSVSGLEA